MVTKKQKRSSDLKTKKKKKGTRLLILLLIILTVFGSLIFLFVTLFDSLYPPVAGKGERAFSKREKWLVTLYFSDANERFLEPEKRLIPKEKDISGQTRELVKALLEGSKANFVNTFPAKTELQNVKIENGQKAYISFSKSLVKNHPKSSTSEMATIYSLTNTLTANIPALKEVTLQVDGKELPSIGGHVDTRHAFTTNKDLLAPSAK